MKRASIVVLMLLIELFPLAGQGLEFRSMNNIIDARTSYEVFHGRIPRFQDKLTISFDLRLSPESRFGYIFRLGNILDEGHIWNLSLDSRDRVHHVIRINEEGFRSAICAELSYDELPYYKWERVQVTFDAPKDSVHLYIGHKRYSQRIEYRCQDFKPAIHFGVSGHVVELPSFALRDLVISDGARSIQFLLDEFSGEKVHDSAGASVGIVRNPEWLSYDTSHWKHVASFSSDNPGGICYDAANHEVLLYGADSMKKFSFLSSKLSEVNYPEPCPVNILSGTSFIKDGYLYAYELYDWIHGPGGPSVARMNLSTLEWTALGSGRLDGPMHHHSAFLNPTTGKETFYGGYGDMYFNGDFFTLGDDGIWHRELADRVHDPQLTPRFFNAAGVSPDGRYAYIFGGLGNETGEEVVGRRYFYDLHRYDMETGECSYLWTAQWPYEPSIPARGLIVRDDCFYALCYPEYQTESTAYLYRFSLADGSVQRMADGITVNSDKIWCNTNLFFDAELGKLVVACANVDKSLAPSVDLYTLIFPPSEPVGLKRHGSSLRLAGYIGMALTCILGLMFYRWRRRRIRKRQASDRYVLSQTDASKKLFRSSESPDSISLFGELTIYDSSGANITHSFSQQARALLLLLLEYSDSGLSASRINNILWPDKDLVKARNSRGVAISNLRRLLSGVEGISLTFEENLYRIRTTDALNYDLRDFQVLASSGKTDEALCLLSRGAFLKDTVNPLFDSYKSDTETMVISFLTEALNSRADKGDTLAAIEISDMLFEYDPLDENALRKSIMALLSLGRRDDALVRYSHFQTLWQKINGEAYPVKFNEL